MRKELPYFQIEGAYGGNQDWLKDPMMKLGGCAALTVCDTSIYLALHQNKTHLFPFALDQLNKEAYIQFSKKMKPYLAPRIRGIDRLEIYIEGMEKYLKDTGDKEIKVTGFAGESNVEDAMKVVKKQIDMEIPIPYLLLKHKKKSMDFFTWHWFLLVGYEEFDDEMMVKAATYGAYHWLSLRELWDTGYKEKGGMILLNK
ncbi:hypothetical protein [Candidatus Galacturonibacter soehngenii]|uniref:Uncharacterized protein n=1 Tax=Candidatus Galacturonatibacter soehngenii TaxID=2307010 RepID=A0A7V7UBS7_9FIRM|nr:hypothetical protein [Candidatus Galacturonibacter soehngenii]KAB1437899.1 hypothetical protein F7O84_09945 [Candidatus Galacturonibacter soehngenii]MBA4687678.1 hypothetical protein [Candidatus Galacturonibacter soehngenii]